MRKTQYSGPSRYVHMSVDVRRDSEPEDIGGCEIEQPAGWYCTRDFHHNGPCAAKRLPDLKCIADGERLRTGYPLIDLVVALQTAHQRVTGLKLSDQAAFPMARAALDTEKVAEQSDAPQMTTFRVARDTDKRIALIFESSEAADQWLEKAKVGK